MSSPSTPDPTFTSQDSASRPTRPFSPSPPRDNIHTASRPPSLFLGAPFPISPSLSDPRSFQILGLPDTAESRDPSLYDGMPRNELAEDLFGYGDREFRGRKTSSRIGRPGEVDRTPATAEIAPTRDSLSMVRSMSAGSLSSDSSSSPPLGSASILATLASDAEIPSISPSSSRQLSGRSSRHSTPLPDDFAPRSPQSAQAQRTSMVNSSSLASSKSMPRLHQPTVVRSISGKGVSFLPPPGHVVASSNTNSARSRITRASTSARSSLPAVAGGKDGLDRTTRYHSFHGGGSSRPSLNTYFGDLGPPVQFAAPRGTLTGSGGSRDREDQAAERMLERGVIEVGRDDAGSADTKDASATPNAPTPYGIDDTIPPDLDHTSTPTSGRSSEISSGNISADIVGQLDAEGDDEAKRSARSSVLDHDDDDERQTGERADALPVAPAATILDGIKNVSPTTSTETPPRVLDIAERETSTNEEELSVDESQQSTFEEEHVHTPLAELPTFSHGVESADSTDDAVEVEVDAVNPIKSNGLGDESTSSSLLGEDDIGEHRSELEANDAVLVKASDTAAESPPQSEEELVRPGQGGTSMLSPSEWMGGTRTSSGAKKESVGGRGEIGEPETSKVTTPNIEIEEVGERTAATEGEDEEEELEESSRPEFRFENAPIDDIKQPPSASASTTSMSSSTIAVEGGITHRSEPRTTSAAAVRDLPEDQMPVSILRASVPALDAPEPEHIKFEPALSELDFGDQRPTTKIEAEESAVEPDKAEEEVIQSAESSPRTSVVITGGSLSAEEATSDGGSGSSLSRSVSQDTILNEITDDDVEDAARAPRDVSSLAVPDTQNSCHASIYIPPYQPRKAARNRTYHLSSAQSAPKSSNEVFAITVIAGVSRRSKSDALSLTIPHIELYIAWYEPHSWLWVPARKYIPAAIDVRLVGSGNEVVVHDPAARERQQEAERRRGLVRSVVRGVVGQLPIVWRFAGWM